MIVTRAPLRIPLGGGGTDFPSYYLRHGGYILGFAIQKYVYCVLHPTIDGKVRLKYSKNEVVDDADQLTNRVAAEALKHYGLTKGVEVATFSDVPESSGLGGSSAFCVALIAAMRQLKGLSLDRSEIFREAYMIERVKADQQGGIQDQLFASLGGCWSTTLGDGEPKLEMMNLNGLLPRLKLVRTEGRTSSNNLEIANTQTSDTLAKKSSTLESLDSTKKLGLLLESCIKSGDMDRVGPLFNEHWGNKKSRDASISNPELDAMYSRALVSGATGGKLIGLGGGGYFLFYVPGKLEGFDTIDLQIDWEGVRVLYED